MDNQAITELLEFSEVRAYESLVSAAEPSLVKQYGYSITHFGSAVAVKCHGVLSSLNMNRVIGLGVKEPVTEADLHAITRHYWDDNISFGLEACPSAQTEVLSEWAKQNRIRRGLSSAMIYRPAVPLEVPIKPDLIVRNTKPHERPLVAEWCCRTFNMPEPAGALVASTADDPRWTQWIAFLDETPIAIGLLFMDCGVGWVSWDCTLPEYRGRGAQTALMAARFEYAFQRNCTYITGETALTKGTTQDPSLRNLQRLGFATVYNRPTYVAICRRNVEAARA